MPERAHVRALPEDERRAGRDLHVCGAGPVEKILFPVAVHFKGSGFYSTDYGKGRKKAARDGGETASTDTPKTDKAEKSTTEKGSADKKPTRRLLAAARAAGP